MLWYNVRCNRLLTRMGGIMKFSETGDTLYCSFADRLDGFVCSEVEHELVSRTTEFKNERTNVRLIFDLSGVVFVSSAFLRLCLMHLKAFGKDCFFVTNVSDELHKVFHISGFGDIMNVLHSDTTPALA